MNRAPAVRRAVVAVLAVLALQVVLLASTALPAPAASGRLDVVTVLPGVEGGAAAVVQVSPPPLADLRQEAVSVSAAGGGLPARVEPVLAAGAPTAFVVDGSQAGAASLGPSQSGMTGLLLKLQSDTRVTVVADRSPPRLVTPTPVGQTAALGAISAVTSGGPASTSAALRIALRQVAGTAGRSAVVVLTTSGPAPADAAQIAELFRTSDVALAVAATGGHAASWQGPAASTGGLAVASGPGTEAAAFQNLFDALRSRYVVSFTPPAGARTARVLVQSGGLGLAATADLAGLPPAAFGPAAAGAGSGTASGASDPGSGVAPVAPGASGGSSTGSPSAGSGDSRLWLVLALVLVLAPLLGATIAAAVRRRRRRVAPAPPAPVAEPTGMRILAAAPEPEPRSRPRRAPAPPAAAPADPAGPLPGVRVFDPQSLTELDPVTLRPSGPGGSDHGDGQGTVPIREAG